MSDHNPKAHCMSIGGGELREERNHWGDSSDADAIAIAPWRRKEDLEPILQEMDWFVLSEFDGFPPVSGDII